jgi:hypothetical protein
VTAGAVTAGAAAGAINVGEEEVAAASDPAASACLRELVMIAIWVIPLLANLSITFTTSP